jgi:hypothetical protein
MRRVASGSRAPRLVLIMKLRDILELLALLALAGLLALLSLGSELKEHKRKNLMIQNACPLDNKPRDAVASQSGPTIRTELKSSR